VTEGEIGRDTTVLIFELLNYGLAPLFM
jgi:hypothetical protein